MAKINKHKDSESLWQRLINIKIAKAYRTVSNEALCIITGLKPIHIKINRKGELQENVN